MPKLLWHETGTKFYETGVDRGVLFVKNTENGKYKNGVAWQGLVSVSESPSGAEANPQYADNTKYLNLYSTEDFGATIEAFTYPTEFEACDGSASIAEGVYATQQTRVGFAFSYRSLIGNDVKANDAGYKLHIVYGAMATPSEKSRSTVNESPEAVTFSWEVTTTSVSVPGFKPTAHVIIDSREVSKENLTKIEDALYGSEAKESNLLMPEDIIKMLEPDPAG